MSDELSYDYIREAFDFLPDWESRYQFIDDLGKKLPPMDEAMKTDDNRVHGCMSLVHVEADIGDDGTVKLHGDCDTSTIKGVVAIVLAIYRGKTASQILEIDADARFEELGLFDHLSPTRHVGVYAIVEHVRRQVGQLLAA